MPMQSYYSRNYKMKHTIFAVKTSFPRRVNKPKPSADALLCSEDISPSRRIPYLSSKINSIMIRKANNLKQELRVMNKSDLKYGLNRS